MHLSRVEHALQECQRHTTLSSGGDEMSHAERMSAFWSAFERGELDRIEAELVSPDVEFVMPGAPKLRGIKQVRQLWESWKAAFPDMKHEEVHAIEGADTYAAETRFTATHTGTLRSA